MCHQPEHERYHALCACAQQPSNITASSPSCFPWKWPTMYPAMLPSCVLEPRRHSLLPPEPHRICGCSSPCSATASLRDWCNVIPPDPRTYPARPPHLAGIFVAHNQLTALPASIGASDCQRVSAQTPGRPSRGIPPFLTAHLCTLARCTLARCTLAPGTVTHVAAPPTNAPFSPFSQASCGRVSPSCSSTRTACRCCHASWGCCWG